MADSAHLEKMGRELKCPICLSLLNSAVSLTCNHMFCSMCISKSMKSGSNCPVCKVPYRRREVRPAPQMDNLVNIYKSMEVASGINIFITQTAPSTKPSDGQNQDDEKNSAPEYERGKSKKRRSLKCKKLKGLENIETEYSDSQTSVKPSFPAKKRIQVPLHPLDETPGKQVSQSVNQSIACEVERVKDKVLESKCEKGSSFVQKEKSAFDEKGNLTFLPFFWLQEEDDNGEGMDKLSAQQVEVDLVTDTPQHNVPTFSDIKDSDDERSPIKLTPTGELHHKSQVASVFDSEMFEWTQRACSPELCSTPIQKLTKYKRSSDGIQKKESGKTSLSESARISNAKQGNKKMHMVSNVMECQQIGNGKVQNARKKTNKPNTKIQRKQRKRTIDTVDDMTTDNVLEEVSIDCDEIAENSNKENEFSKNDQARNSGIQKFQENDAKRSMTRINVANTGIKDSKRCTQINTQSKRKSATRSMNTIARTATAEVLEKAPLINSTEENNQNRQNKKNDMGLPNLSSHQIEDGENLDSVNKTRKRCKNINAHVERTCGKESKKQKRFTDDIAKDGEQENLEIGEKTQKVFLTKENFLQKCENSSNKIQCAFCHSSDDSEASGEMIHYFKGKPVAADYNGSSKIIHSHRNCTEWAPNVYFEDDIAVNLEAELARSKRIKCGCCGIKGATLGCYEMSCRRSFHVPCAKLTPQCRWDSENFVMLCPLHSSSKLPNDLSGTQRQGRKKSTSKLAMQAQAETEQGLNTVRLWTWSHGLPSKWVLACSALTLAEKKIVSEFARVAGVSVSSAWSPTVTHVIASTNENGECRRTLKFLMGIIEGKWILKIDWIVACVKAMEPVDEEPYEIRVDIYGVTDGPRLGRQRVMDKQPKLFSGLEFYFSGEFTLSYKGYLHDIVVAAGGTVLQRKPISRDEKKLLNDASTPTFIIYSLEALANCDSRSKDLVIYGRKAEAHTLANATGAKVTGHTWILDSIAACKFSPLTDENIQ